MAHSPQVIMSVCAVIRMTCFGFMITDCNLHSLIGPLGLLIKLLFQGYLNLSITY
jgi:hypothetical protein